jgi:hypothetical protein
VQIGNPGLQNATNFISRLGGASSNTKSKQKSEKAKTCNPGQLSKAKALQSTWQEPGVLEKQNS